MARSRRRKGRTRGEPGGLLIGSIALAAVLIIGGLGYLYFAAVNGQVERDEIFCPKTGAKSQALILVDTSDSIADLTRNEIKQRLRDVAASTPVGGRITIRTLRPDMKRSDQIFDLCNPGDGSELNDITGNPERARKRWNEGFEGPLSDALERATGDQQSNTSPIMAAIQQYAVDRLVSKSGQETPTSVILVSDMFEHTADFSMYRQGADFAAFASSSAAAKYDTNLQGADVELWLIARTKAPADPDALVNFWEQWISRANGSIARVLKLQGVSDG